MKFTFVSTLDVDVMRVQEEWLLADAPDLDQGYGLHPDFHPKVLFMRLKCHLHLYMPPYPGVTLSIQESHYLSN